MKKNIITVIIPVYNSEKYLEKTIKSILEQTYNNYELILIDNGSTDNSAEICKKYQEKDKRVKFYIQSKKGVSNARNMGIEKATGEFICFVDSDDYVKNDYLSYLYAGISENNADIIISGHTRVNNEREVLEEKEIDNTASYINIDGRNLLFLPVAAGKMYNVRIIEKGKIDIPKSERMDDLAYSLAYNMLADKVVIGKYNGYMYRYNPDSITSLTKSGHDYYEAFPFKGLENALTNVMLMVDDERKMQSALVLMKLLGWFLMIMMRGATFNDVSGFCDYTKKIIKENNIEINNNKYLSKKILSKFDFSTQIGIKLFVKLHKNILGKIVLYLITKL